MVLLLLEIPSIIWEISRVLLMSSSCMSGTHRPLGLSGQNSLLEFSPRCIFVLLWGITGIYRENEARTRQQYILRQGRLESTSSRTLFNSSRTKLGHSEVNFESYGGPYESKPILPPPIPRESQRYLEDLRESPRFSDT
jgi:hypothetical protein